MGLVYCGPFAAEIDEGTEYGHEGYAVQIQHDGSESRYWVSEFREYRAGCGCGWRGGRAYPATEAGESAATDEWDTAHLQVLIGQAAEGKVVTADAVLDLIGQLRGRVRPPVDVGDDEPLSERERGVLDAVDVVEQFLSGRATPAAAVAGSMPGRGVRS